MAFKLWCLKEMGNEMVDGGHCGGIRGRLGKYKVELPKKRRSKGLGTDADLKTKYELGQESEDERSIGLQISNGLETEADLKEKYELDHESKRDHWITKANRREAAVKRDGE